MDLCTVPSECGDRRADFEIPKADRSVEANRRDGLSIWREDRIRDITRMLMQYRTLGAIFHIPQPYRVVVACGYQLFAIGRK